MGIFRMLGNRNINYNSVLFKMVLLVNNVVLLLIKLGGGIVMVVIMDIDIRNINKIVKKLKVFELLS